jgi:uncharacterized protein involved in exopolysaccharide biosynthesis
LPAKLGGEIAVNESLAVRDYLRVLWRYRGIVAAATCAALVVASLMILVPPPVYEAVAVVSPVSPPTLPAAGSQTAFQVGGATPGLNQSPPAGPNITEVLTLQFPSQSLAAFAMLPGVTAEAQRRSPLTAATPAAPDTFAAVVAPGSGPLFVPYGVTFGAPMVELRVRSSDPARAAALANEWAAVVSDKSSGIFQAQARQSLEFFNSQVLSAQRTLAGAEDELRRFEVSDRIDELHARIQALTNQIADYQSREFNLSVSGQQAEGTLKAARSELRDQPESYTLTKAVTTDPVTTLALDGVMRPDVSALSNVRMRSEEMNSVYVALNQQAAGAAVQAGTVAAERAAVGAALRDMQAQLSSMRDRLAAGEFRQRRLSEAVDHARSMYTVLINRQEEARLAAAATQVHAVEIALPAAVPVNRVPVHASRTLALGGIMGLLVGLGAAFLLGSVEAGRPS